MAFVIADNVKETTTTTGTGAVTLGGAVSQYLAFSSVCADGDYVPYCIRGQSGTEWEIGIGKYTTSGTTLTRTTILASSNSNAVVTLSAGTKDVFLDFPAVIAKHASSQAMLAAWLSCS